MPEEKAERKRQRMLDTARQYSTGTYIRRYVAPVFQQMIRAEAAAQPARSEWCIKQGEPTLVARNKGECVCVTYGKVGPWSGGLGGFHTGHFLASRRNAILFEEENVAPQCSRCNRYESGAPQRFREWMLLARGEETVERLEQLKTTTRQFSREELVDMRIEYAVRLRAAKEKMTE